VKYLNSVQTDYSIQLVILIFLFLHSTVRSAVIVPDRQTNCQLVISSAFTVAQIVYQPRNQFQLAGQLGRIQSDWSSRLVFTACAWPESVSATISQLLLSMQRMQNADILAAYRCRVIAAST